MTNKNISQKTRHKNTGTKQLISIVVARYIAAGAVERQSILNFFNWLIQTTAGELQSFHVEVRAQILEVPQP